MYLYDLFPEYKVENQEFECKRTITKNRDNEEQRLNWMKCVAGMSNYLGGDLFIGVEDSSLKLIGFTNEEADKERNYFNNAINEHFTPLPTLDIKFIGYKIKDKERFIIQIHIYESITRPIILKYKGIPSIYVHRNGFTNGATYEEIVNMSIQSNNLEYDRLPSNIPYDSNDFKDLNDFYQEHTEGDKLSEKILKSIGFYNENRMLSNGAVLFMDNYDGDKCTVHCSSYNGFTRGDDRVVTSTKYKGNIVRSISYILEFVDARMNHSYIKLPTGRKDIDAYPKRALFEGIINAVAHRDYFIDGSQIQIDMFKDRLEIFSPGSFYKEERISKTYDLENIISKRRNELICNVFVECKVMEAKGTGFEKIMEAYKEQDENHKPYVLSTSDSFKLVLPDLTYDNGIVNSDYPEVIYPHFEGENTHVSKILSFCYRKAHSAKEIAKYLDITSSSYFRKNILQELIDKEYLTTETKNKTVFYRTNKEYVGIR